MLSIFTGTGKGEATALGQALNTTGDGKNVLMVQFIKEPWCSGEGKAPSAEQVKAAHEAMDYALQKVTQGKLDTIILDEVIDALDLKLIERKYVSYFLEYVRPRVGNIIFTGQNCPAWLIETADLVTEV